MRWRKRLTKISDLTWVRPDQVSGVIREASTGRTVITLVGTDQRINISDMTVGEVLDRLGVDA